MGPSEGYSQINVLERGKPQVAGCASIPGNWASFITVDVNKTELFSFLTDALNGYFNYGDKQLIITDGDAVLGKPLLLDSLALPLCCREKPDYHMMLHAAPQVTVPKKMIFICMVDTDVGVWL